MQQLKFEASWDRALATKDRQLIGKISNSTHQFDHCKRK